MLLCFVSLLSYGQEIDNSSNTIEVEDFQELDSIDVYKIKRLSVGIKLGIPNIAGFSLEGITPLLGNRIAPFADYSSFPVNTVDTDIDLTYIEFGSNFYLGNQGKGVYVGIGFGNLKPNITFKEQEFEENGNRGIGTAVVSTQIKTTNLKLGVKTGGRVYTGGAKRPSWKESVSAEVSSLSTPGMRRTTASTTIAAANSPPLKTYEPIEISLVTYKSRTRWSTPL